MFIVGNQTKNINALNQAPIASENQSLLPVNLKKHLTMLHQDTTTNHAHLSNQLIRLLDASGDCV